MAFPKLEFICCCILPDLKTLCVVLLLLCLGCQSYCPMYRKLPFPFYLAFSFVLFFHFVKMSCIAFLCSVCLVFCSVHTVFEDVVSCSLAHLCLGSFARSSRYWVLLLFCCESQSTFDSRS